MLTQEQLVEEIAREVIVRLRGEMQKASPTPVRHAAGEHGVFETVDEAVNAASAAQEKISAMSLQQRGEIVSIVRRICLDRADELGRSVSAG